MSVQKNTVTVEVKHFPVELDQMVTYDAVLRRIWRERTFFGRLKDPGGWSKMKFTEDCHLLRNVANISYWSSLYYNRLFTEDWNMVTVTISLEISSSWKTVPKVKYTERRPYVEQCSYDVLLVQPDDQSLWKAAGWPSWNVLADDTDGDLQVAKFFEDIWFWRTLPKWSELKGGHM